MGGILECPQHGLQGVAWTCKHLAEGLADKQFVPYREVGAGYYLCAACYRRTALYYLAGVPGLGFVARVWTGYRLGTIYGGCPECLKELQYHAAKQSGRPVPYVGYERTLNWSHQEEIGKLETSLQRRFTFQPSRRPMVYSSGSSLFILPGSFTEPLTIIIYYVTGVAEQESILAFTRNFLAGSDFPQHKILFYEAERWHEEIRSNSRSYQPLKGVLLREVVVA